jgi:hypothetical protein
MTPWQVSLKLTVTVLRDGSSAPGAFVGAAASDRDATLLRSQIEPWSTLALRRRLEATFGEPLPREGEEPSRAAAMERLLECYAHAGPRKLVRVNGTPVAPELLLQLRRELQAWVGKEGTRERQHMEQQERPSIRAQSYMILRAPSDFEPKLQNNKRNHKAHNAKLKFEKNRRLWDLAAAAMARFFFFLLPPPPPPLLRLLRLTHNRRDGQCGSRFRGGLHSAGRDAEL